MQATSAGEKQTLYSAGKDVRESLMVAVSLQQVTDSRLCTRDSEEFCKWTSKVSSERLEAYCCMMGDCHSMQ